MSHSHKTSEGIAHATDKMAGAIVSDHERLLSEEDHAEPAPRLTFDVSAIFECARPQQNALTAQLERRVLAEMIMDLECERHAIQRELERLRLLQQAAQS